ncbi:alpha/beta hydrolase [Micromonospora sp. NBC_00421]|uniref:alpha/beta hydrolase n=1 Tax=Micromonospora sp. NBC_00421 TaxID=2975976 RepID=UPI002E228612
MRVDLWDGPVPHGVGPDEDVPHLDVHLPPPEQATGAAMLVLPGGAYTFLSKKSGLQYARWLATEGIAAAVVNFRLGSAGHRFPALLADAWQALALLRSRADEWGLDPERVGVIGSSAGAHLASMMLTAVSLPNQRTKRPALGVLCYPVVSMNDPLAHEETRRNFLGELAGDEDQRRRFSAEMLVDDQVTPCFVWHTLDDDEVTARNATTFARVLYEAGVSCELHIYQSGPHALGLARNTGLHWTADCIRWLRHNGF